MKIRNVLFFLVGVCFYLQAAPKDVTQTDIRDLSFKECLDVNYSKLNEYKRPGLNDKSYLLTWFAIYNDSGDKAKGLKQYIEKKTGNYYLSKPAIKDPEGNMIFFLCMRFYNSSELDEYIVKNIFN